MSNDHKLTPILPYDITFAEDFSMYQRMTYQQDKDLCGMDSIRIISGNLYKYYSTREIETALIGETKD